MKDDYWNSASMCIAFDIYHNTSIKVHHKYASSHQNN